MNGYQSRFNFYNNTNLLNNRNNYDSNRVNNVNQQQQQEPEIIVTSKSTIKTANLNNKAREELLEKRKNRAKEQPHETNELKTNIETKSSDNTPAIPITSYSSFNVEKEDDEDDDEEEDDESYSKSKQTEQSSIFKKNFTIDLKKRKIEVLKLENIKKQTIKKPKNNDTISNGDINSEEEDNSYFNIFKTKSETANTTNKLKNKSSVLKMKLPIKKQPIIKAGQTQKDREEINTLFIGPKLPDNNDKLELDPDQKVNRNIQWKQAKVINESNLGIETSEAIEEPQSDSPQRPAGPKINYSKDELAKYDDLSKLSQLYAKINQVGVLNFGPNGVTEINMVELDHSQVLRNQASLENSNNSQSAYNLIEINYDLQQKNLEQQNLAHLIQQQSENNEQINRQEEHQIHYSMDQLHQFNVQAYQTLQQQQSELQSNDQSENNLQTEQAISLQMSELEGLSVPKDVTISQTPPAIVSQKATTPNAASSTPIVSVSTSPLQPTFQSNISSSSQTVLLHPHNRIQYQPIQPIQLLSLQNHNNHLIQYAATNPTPVQQLLNLQQIQLNSQHNRFLQSLDGFGLGQLNPSFLQQNSQLTGLSSHQLTTLQASQSQAQQTHLEALLNHQTSHQPISVQAFSPFQYLQAPTFPQATHPQFIQLRPNAYQAASLPASSQQPQFIINSPFYPF